MKQTEKLLLIAKFMDWTDESGQALMDEQGNEIDIQTVELQWNWVMLVVEKIATMDDRRFNVRQAYCDMCIWDTSILVDKCCAEQYDHKIPNIENTVNTIVEFIEYYGLAMKSGRIGSRTYQPDTNLIKSCKG